MEETLYSKLETTALFSGLTANAIEEQLKSLHYSLQKVPAKTLFMAEHHPLH
ncbi:MAG: Crp/Fnr family transcriptional regulator, partial [Prevotella salivae]|nr:Crp/Fnr family transcriptional regulator [Segatella salivae]